MAVCCPLQGCYDYADAGSTEVRTARKEHECEECGELIAKGTKYQNETTLYDGRWSTHKICLSCVEIRDHFQCDGWLYGHLWSDLEENFFPDMKAGGPCMEGLSPEAKSRLFERRMKWLEEESRRSRTRRNWFAPPTATP